MDELPKIEVTVRTEAGAKIFTATLGQNLRALLLEKEITPYRGAYRAINCQGLGVCGSCRVKVREGDQWWSRRSCQIRCFQSFEIELE